MTTIIMLATLWFQPADVVKLSACCSTRGSSAVARTTGVEPAEPADCCIGCRGRCEECCGGNCEACCRASGKASQPVPTQAKGRSAAGCCSTRGADCCEGDCQSCCGGSCGDCCKAGAEARSDRG